MVVKNINMPVTGSQTPRAIAGGGKSGANNTAYGMQRRLGAMKSHQFEIISNFTKQGYRNREDITILPPGVMVLGSYNVLTNVGGRIGVTQGFTLDGQKDITLGSITSSFDWTKITNNDTHVRGNSNSLINTVEFRYVNPVTSLVTWTSLGSVFVPAVTNYTTFWDINELTTVMLFVNGGNNIFEWSGAVASFQSATVNTITKMGTTTWAQEGFYQGGVRRVVIGGTSYTYTGGEGTTTLTGVAPDPSLAGYAVGDAIWQELRTFSIPTFPGLIGNFTFKPDLIGNLTASTGEQIYLGATNNSFVYISRSQDYKNYTQVLPAFPRAPGDGAIKQITGYPQAFINQEENMYISSGKDFWYRSIYQKTTTSVSDGAGGQISTVYETLDLVQLKTTSLQGAQSQSAMTKIKNNIAYLSYEPIVNTLGPVENVFQSPQITDLSYTIVNDMNDYDFTDASMIYFRQYLYLSVPKEGLIRIYNMTSRETDTQGTQFHYWESPVTFPIARFSIIDDALYGHGYSVPETYKLFDGYTFNGHPIPARVNFSYNNYGSRTYPKVFNLFYLEGYITSNTTLNYGFNYDIDGCQTTRSYTLDGDNKTLVCIPQDDPSFGKPVPGIGKGPFSGLIPNPFSTGLPPKFRAIKQLSEFPFYEMQIFFESLGSSQQWELVACGPNAKPASEGNNSRQY